MKKQILITILIFLTGISFTWGQATQNSAPRLLEECETDALNPIAGVPYVYEANASPDGGAAYWYATFSETFMEDYVRVADEEAAGGGTVASGSNYMETIDPANNPIGTTITWTTDGLAAVDETNPLFVVLEYASPECSNNLKVYRINPMNAFLVNIMNLDGEYDVEASSCFDEVRGATYNLGTDMMEYDFGENVMAFEVIAANFTGSYTPEFRIEGLQANQEAEIFWSVTNDFDSGASIGTLDSDGVIEGAPVSTDVEDTSLGVSIYVWVVVSHNDFEGLGDTPITLAVAGVNSADQPNVSHLDCTEEIDINADLLAANGPDHATHRLQPRPTVTPVDPLEFEEQVQP